MFHIVNSDGFLLKVAFISIQYILVTLPAPSPHVSLPIQIHAFFPPPLENKQATKQTNQKRIKYKERKKKKKAQESHT